MVNCHSGDLGTGVRKCVWWVDRLLAIVDVTVLDPRTKPLAR
jgi:hypothetical protein